jgi:O-antigen/teichoic acid export membrane protein
MDPDTLAAVVAASHDQADSPGVSPAPVLPAGIDTTERLRLMRDGVVNYSGYVVSGVAGIILVPVLLRVLGSESYGLWLAALAVSGMFGGIDFGLYWSVTREISATLTSKIDEETSGFVASAGNLYLLLGLVGAGLIAGLGFPISGGLHLSARNSAIAPEVFLLVAATFLADRMVLFGNSALAGLRRFGVMNAITIGAVLVRLIGCLGLLWMRRSILAIALCNLVVSILWAWVGLQKVKTLEPRLRFRFGYFRWPLVRPHFSFGALSFLTALADRMIWEVAPLIIGFFWGSGSIVPYSIGRRFPIALYDVNSRMAETLFPAASERMKANDWDGTRNILRLGTRWILVMAMPISIILWIVTPNLLRVWVGAAMPGASLIMRLTVAAVLAHALGMGAMYVLWGRGAVRTVVTVLGVVAIPSLALTLVLARPLAGVGAAWALCVSLSTSACVFVFIGARTCRLRITELLGGTFRGLLVPNAVCALCTFAVIRLARPEHWISVIAACLAGGVVYIAALYFSGARREEKLLLREALGLRE